MTQLIHWEPWQLVVQWVVLALVAGPIIGWKVARGLAWLRGKK